MSDPSHPSHQHPPHGLDVPRGVAAMLLPGLGHVLRGETKRGVFAAVGVLGMFFGGMLIGGVDIVDSREDKWWFYGQAFVGPLAFGVDWYHQNQLKAYGVPYVVNENTGDEGYLTSDRELASVHRPRSVFPSERREMVEVTVFRGPGGKRETRTLPVAVPADTAAGETGAPPNIKGMAKVNEIGTLYALCAGMLNLIVILDALFPTIRPRVSKASRPAPASDAAADNPAQPKPAPGSAGDPRVASEGGADA